ncbi:MAG: hypothetical protein ACREIB_00235 [Pseudomonadota bacterium]
MEKPFGIIDPNSQHQLWSRWIFGVEASLAKLPPVKECADNARRYFAKGFQSTVGRVRCDQQGTYYCFIVEIEGPPGHDLEYVESVKRNFVERFMAQGFGPSARLVRFEVGILAGDQQDGKPPDQMLVMPGLATTARLHSM